MSFRSVEFRVEYFKVNSSLLDQAKVELKLPKLKERPKASRRQAPESGPHPARFSESENKNDVIKIDSCFNKKLQW